MYCVGLHCSILYSVPICAESPPASADDPEPGPEAANSQELRLAGSRLSGRKPNSAIGLQWLWFSRSLRRLHEIACLGKGRTQDLLIGAATHAAPCEYSVNHDRGHRADAIPPRLRRYLRFVHVMDDYRVPKPSKPFDDFYSFSAC